MLYMTCVYKQMLWKHGNPCLCTVLDKFIYFNLCHVSNKPHYPIYNISVFKNYVVWPSSIITRQMFLFRIKSMTHLFLISINNRIERSARASIWFRVYRWRSQNPSCFCQHFLWHIDTWAVTVWDNWTRLHSEREWIVWQSL